MMMSKVDMENTQDTMNNQLVVLMGVQVDPYRQQQSEDS